jgi:hypothetical protein
LAGGHTGQGAGFGGNSAHAANSRIAPRTALRMWVIYLEVLLALGLAVFIVWFTWPKKRKEDAKEKRADQ